MKVLPSSFNLIIVKDSLFVDGGVSRNKGIIKMVRNNDKMIHVGTVVLSKPDNSLLDMIASLDVNQYIRKEQSGIAESSTMSKSQLSQVLKYTYIMTKDKDPAIPSSDTAIVRIEDVTNGVGTGNVVIYERARGHDLGHYHPNAPLYRELPAPPAVNPDFTGLSTTRGYMPLSTIIDEPPVTLEIDDDTDVPKKKASYPRGTAENTGT